MKLRLPRRSAAPATAPAPAPTPDLAPSEPTRRRICVVGNSHLAAFKVGWDSLGDTDVEPTFITAASKGLGDLQLADGWLRAPSPLREEILQLTGTADAYLPDYEAVVLIGLDFGVSRLGQVFNGCRTWRSGDPVGPVQLVSEACFADTCWGTLNRSTAIGLVRRLRDASDTRLIVIPAPGVSEAILEADGKANGWKDVVAMDRTAEIEAAYQWASADFARELGFELVSQPAQTLKDGIFTRVEYGTLDVRLDGAERRKGKRDYGHANAEYGAMVAQDVRARLGS